MSEETGNISTPTNQEVPAPSTEDNVTMSKQEYADLMTKFTNMEDALSQLLDKELEKEQERENIKRQRSENEAAQRRAQAPNLDELSNTDLANIIMNQVTKQVGEPLLEMIATMALKEEKKELVSDLKDEGINFKDYEEETFKVATANTSLSLKEAFYIAKRNKDGGTHKKKEGKEEPPAPTGERPGAQKTHMRQGGPMSLEEAAKRALEEAYTTTKED